MQHPEKVSRVVRVGQQIKRLEQPRLGDLITDIAQGREILDREAHGVKQRDLLRIAAAFGLPEPVTAVVDARRERAYVQRFPDGAPGLVALADFAPETAISGPGAALLSARTLPQPVPIAEAIARIAAQRFATETRPPAPLYIRPADAAPARDLPPVILDEA